MKYIVTVLVFATLLLLSGCTIPFSPVMLLLIDNNDLPETNAIELYAKE